MSINLISIFLKSLYLSMNSFFLSIRDEYRSLPDMKDRIFSTIVTADWTYNTARNKTKF